MHYSTRHGPSKRRNALANPVAKAIAVRQIQQHLRTVQTLAYVLEDGEPAADQLGHMAWILGLGSEVAVSIGDERCRQLHGALRTVHGMALSGYCWQARLAPPIDAALGHAAHLITQHSDIAWTMLAGAEWLAHRISTRTTAAADVAGAELYAQAPAAEIPPLATPTHGGEGARQTAVGVNDQQAAARPVSKATHGRPAAVGDVLDKGLAADAPSPAEASWRAARAGMAGGAA